MYIQALRKGTTHLFVRVSSALVADSGSGEGRLDWTFILAGFGENPAEYTHTHSLVLHTQMWERSFGILRGRVVIGLLACRQLLSTESLRK